MAKDPAFPFYAQDFLSGTAFMTLEEKGAYITLLSHQWNIGKIPKKRLGFVLGFGWESIWENISEKFEEVDGFIFNTRLEVEREKRTVFKNKQSFNGKKGGRPLKDKPKLNPNDTQTIPKKKPLEDEYENEKEDEIVNENEIGIINEIFEKEFTDLLAEYFLQTTEVQKMRITGFLMSKNIKPQIDNFKEQTIAYAKYKKLTGEKIHNWTSYQSEWDREDWIKKLKRETNGKQVNNQTGADQEFRDKTAKRLGIIKS